MISDVTLAEITVTDLKLQWLHMGLLSKQKSSRFCHHIIDDANLLDP